MKGNEKHKKRIVKYYEDSRWLYQHFWYSKRSLGLHFGIDGDGSENIDQTIVNQYKQLIKLGSISKSKRVLDAGCGVGGASLYLAKHTGAQVYGISIVDDQIAIATNHKLKQGLDNVDFSNQDYTNTNFKHGYFDVIFGIESVCYAYPKSEFLKEAYRILKPGGKLIIVDGYKNKDPNSDLELTIDKDFCYGWKLREMVNIKEMEKEIRHAGFYVEQVEDLTPRIGKTLKRFNWLWRLGSLVQFLPGVKDNVLAIKNVIAGVRCRLYGYYLVVATKI